ncbi:MAG: prepilin peptidase [Minisyncoccales bacterium]
MGFGDVKLVIFLGLLLGFPNILPALFIAFASGAIIGLAMMGLKKRGMKSEIPFGPFLVFGTFVALFFGNDFIQWYLSLM